MKLKKNNIERIEYGRIRAKMEGDFSHLSLEALIRDGDLVELIVKDKSGSKRVTHWKGSLVPRHNQINRWEFLRQLGEFIEELLKIR